MTATESVGSMDALIDSTVGDGASAPPTSSESAPEPIVEETPGEAAEAAPAAEAPPAEPVAEPVAEPSDEFADDDFVKPDHVSRDGKYHYYTKERADRLIQANQAWRTVQEAIPGATVDSLKEMYGVSAAIEKMQADFQTGDLNEFVSFWHDQNPGAFAQMATQMPDFLLKNNPQAFQQLERNMDTRLIERIYNTAATRNDEELYNLAQHLDQKLNGKFMPRDEIRKQRDPVINQNRQFEAERQQYYADRAADRQRQVEAWVQATNTAVSDKVNGLVQKALTSNPAIAKAFEGKPEMGWMKRDLQEKIGEAEKANPSWMRQYEALQKQAKANPSEQTRDALVQMKEQFAAAVIRKTLKSVIDAASGRIESQSAAAHARQQQSATRREPANAGAPVQGVAVNPKMRSAKTMDELLSAAFS